MKIRSENSLEPALFILIIEQNNGSDMNRLLAIPAGGRFSLRVLNEPIGKVIIGAGATGCFRSLGAAIRAGELDAIFSGISISPRMPRFVVTGGKSSMIPNSIRSKIN